MPERRTLLIYDFIQLTWEEPMTTFLQLHLLTSYPPACLNRDDLNRPKTAMMGGVPRLRISSQSLKRAWRTSEQFEASLKNHVGTRTKLMGVQVYQHLTKAGVAESKAKEWTQAIAAQFGKLKAKKQDELKLLREKHKAADIALFGRMLADSPKYNVKAACQVAHAVTVHRAAVEDDFFTAVDDLNTREEDAGSAHMGEQGFGAGLFYVYLCIDCNLLKANLNDDTELAGKAIRALIDAATKVAPTGKQNSFASRAWAYYGLAEKGSRQPRSLSLAFMKPVREGDMLTDAAKALETMRGNLDKVYYEGKAESSKCFNAVTGEGLFRELLNWAADCGEA
jgi:CRISPR system Cascade subunit CasC